MKIGDVKLLKRLSKPLTELLDYEIHKETVRSAKGGETQTFAGWWFQIFFIFTPVWGNDPILTNIFQMG